MIYEAKRELDAAMAAPILAAMRRQVHLPPAPEVTIPVEPQRMCPHCNSYIGPTYTQRRYVLPGGDP